MDDDADGEYSRAPRIEDVARLCQSLNDQRARYLLIGGFAMILHGSVRGTKAIDLLVDPAPDNVRALKRALAVLPDNAVRDVDDGDLLEFGVVRVADEIVVDLMPSACGIVLADLSAPLALGPGAELGQAVGLLRGTFDIVDLGPCLGAFAVALAEPSPSSGSGRLSAT